MIPALFLLLSAVAYRVTMGLLVHSGATWLSNFTPLAAIALCSAAYFPVKYKFTVPFIALFISDAVLNFHYGAAIVDPLILCRYLALALTGCIGLLLGSAVGEADQVAGPRPGQAENFGVVGREDRLAAAAVRVHDVQLGEIRVGHGDALAVG